MCMIVVLTVVGPPAVQCTAQQRQRRYCVDLPLLMRPRESTNDCARSFSIWSAWRSFRGVLLHHHCLTLAGPPRIHVAKQLCQACAACGGADVTAFSFRPGKVCDRALNGANLDLVYESSPQTASQHVPHYHPRHLYFLFRRRFA